MRLPNGPQKRSFLYTRTIQWIFRPLEVLETYAQRYGDPFRIYALPTSFLTRKRSLTKSFIVETQSLGVNGAIAR